MLMPALRSLWIAFALSLMVVAPAGAISHSDLLTTQLVTIGSELGIQPILGSDFDSCAAQGETWQCTASSIESVYGGWQLTNVILTFDLDPFVNFAFGFVNTGATSDFFLQTSTPVAPIGPTTRVGGSTGGSVTDANNDGVGGMRTVAPNPFYVGLIDTVPVPGAELHPDPFFVPGPGFPGAWNFAGETQNIPATSFGLPGPTSPGPPVAASIGIRHEFRLAGGDSISATSFFVVEPIPEPVTAALFGMGLLGLGIAARRRR